MNGYGYGGNFCKHLKIHTVPSYIKEKNQEVS